MKNNSKARHSRQRGAAYAETLVSFGIIALFLLGSQYIWKFAEFRQQMTDATRFAAWERTVWEPDDNSTEKFALHQANSNLARSVLIHQFSTPAAWRGVRDNLNRNGTATAAVDSTDRENLKSATKYFVADGISPGTLVSVSTNSGWTNQTENKFRGMDPTFGKLTSLELDRNTYRTTEAVFHTSVNPSLESRLFSFLMPADTTSKKLALVTNSWAASPAVNIVRSNYQLLPLSNGHAISGTKANNLAYFGMNQNNGVGLAPLWDLAGGANGFGGQFVVDKIGMDANAANNLVRSAGNSWASSSPFNPNELLLGPQLARSEFIQPNASLVWELRHTFVIDESSLTKNDTAGDVDKARDASVGKRKYKAVSLANPVDSFTKP